LSKLSTIFVWTHDSIGLGEDGPTHQAVEQLMSLRDMPEFSIIRPGDANETAQAWRAAMRHAEGAAGIVCCRQDLPVLDRSGAKGDVSRGAYIFADASSGTPALILMATGSELHLAVGARQKLEAEGVPTRVVSMPCWEFFEEQPPAYRDEVLPPSVKARLSIEAGGTLGWGKRGWDGEDSIGGGPFGAPRRGGTAKSGNGFTAWNVECL